MLAYVFWHWKRADVDAAYYAGRLSAFHEALRRSAPEGFASSAAFRSGPSPWVLGAESYEDWYLTHGSFALDPLNDGAVSGDCQLPHDSAARSAAGGTAGLYRLRLGAAEVRHARIGYWFAKPEGMSYGDFFARMRPLAERAETGLWGRQMTLGPTPEFCLMSPIELDLPGELDPITRPLERIWPTTVRGLPQEAMELG